MPTVYECWPDYSDQGDPAACDPVVVEWDDKRDGGRVYTFASGRVAHVRKLARPY